MRLHQVIFTGFTIPTRYMLGWSRWINYLNPIGYGFESLMVNEFHDRTFACSAFVPVGPGYETASVTNRICTAVGATAGSNFVEGDAYINSSFQYYHAHKWR
jgi:ATP-binding cassette subfamily G (WHITE) protein 2 (PDR)